MAFKNIDADFQFDPVFSVNDNSGKEDSPIFGNNRDFILYMFPASNSRIGGAYAAPKNDDDVVQVVIGKDGFLYVKTYPHTPEEVGALPKEGTAKRTTADADGNVVIDTYLTKNELDEYKPVVEDTYATKEAFNESKSKLDVHLTKADLSGYEDDVKSTYSTKDDIKKAESDFESTYVTDDELNKKMVIDVADVYIQKSDVRSFSKSHSKVQDKNNERITELTVGEGLTVYDDGRVSVDEQVLSKISVIDERIDEKIEPAFAIQGSVTDRSSLPSSSKNGQMYYVDSDEEYVVYINGEWEHYADGASFTLEETGDTVGIVIGT